MFRIAIIALLAVMQTSIAQAQTSCNGADPVVNSAVVSGVTPNGQLNVYNIRVTVTNAGSAAQAKDVLQFVDVYMVSQKLDAKGIPPLGPGQSYTFDYPYQRSQQAGNGTTTLRFALDMHNEAPGGDQDCNTDNDRTTVTF